MANEEYFDFEEVLERINNLEVVVAELLKGPELNYKSCLLYTSDAADE